MKKVLIALMIIISGNAYCQETEKASLYIFRSTGFSGSLMNAPINLDDNRCALQNDSFIYKELEGGTYFLSTHKAKDPIKIDFEAGNTYFFKVDMNMGVLSARFSLTEITERGAKEYIENEKIKQKECF